ncbi:PREDICTED: centrosomal protein KIAA1731 homolog [Chrysochloris asiatica]|uniref:Centrosomal protein KIAA1731 homolog n=1 Tax=Chrysochloris asiatica TaxID=185453 RepID=A0A9B0U0M9_CHRAS|nr:PREDICTED: centrosomal protein KIAA1731 homolog [Chrysochloris asiatica]
MKRKVVKASRLRLSPNEEAVILKEDYERRRKLRLLQVREQERDIALQIREDIKQRRNQQFTRLAEELRAEWEETQTQKIKNLEKLYLASLRNMGEGHRQAKENEPNLDGLAQRAAERKKRAEMRHKEALKIQKNQKEILMKQKNRHIKARKEALLVEKERSAKITSLPPPPPALFENIDVKRTPAVKTNSSTYHHLYSLVNREMDTKQPDPHLAAEEEAKRLEALQKQVAQERLEQFEKAHVRGFHAMKKIHLAQNQEKLMKELKQLQQEDLARRRQNVARMPPRLVELPYKRSETKEDWQRELEFAFEDMYNADRKVKGNLILHLEPEPLPTLNDQTQDEQLDLSMKQENLNETDTLQVTEVEKICPSEIDVPLAMKTQQAPSKIIFKKLLNKIRSQKSLWTIKSVSEDESEMPATISETESKVPTVESGTIVSEEQTLSTGLEQVVESDALTIESGPLSTEDKPLSCSTDSENQREVHEAQPITSVVQSSVLLHPQEEAARIRISARQKQIMEIEEQKQRQLDLLEQIEQQKLRLETDCFKAQLEEANRKKTQQIGVGSAPASSTVVSDEDSHRQMIRNYQHQLLEQNRLHRQSIEAARKQLHDYQTMLKERYLSVSAASVVSDSIVSEPPQKYERSTVMSEHWDQDQRRNMSPENYQPIQVSKLEQSRFQVPRETLFSPRQIETMGTSSTSNVLAKQSVESQGHQQLFSQAGAQKRDHRLIPEDSHRLSRALSQDRSLVFQDPTETSQTSRTTPFQTLDSQQMLSENSQSISSKLTDPSSFLPLVAEHSFSSLPAKSESGIIQEALSTKSRSTYSLSHSVISQIQDRPLPSLEHITAQQSNLKALQEQLDLQKEVLRAKQESQQQQLLHKQKELEEQIGLSLFIPLVAPRSFASLPSTKAESVRIQESSLPKSDTAVCSGHPVVPQIQDRLLNFSQTNLSQQNNFKFHHEQLNVRKDRMQARREAQEVLRVHKQSELDGSVSSEQAESSTLPFQIDQHKLTSLSAEAKSGTFQPQYSSKSDKGVLSSQSEIPASQDRSSSFLQQFLPLHDSLKLLQEQLSTQRDALQARHETQAELLLHRQKGLDVRKSRQLSSSFSMATAHDSVASHSSAKTEPRRIQNLHLSEESLIPSNHLVIPTFQDKSLPSFPQHSLPQQENLEPLQEQLHMQRVVKGANQETWEFEHKHSELDKRFSSEQVDESERSQEFMSLKSESTCPLSHSVIPSFQERPLRLSQQVIPLKDNLEACQGWLHTKKDALHFSQNAQQSRTPEQTGQLEQLLYTSLPSAVSGTVQERSSVEGDSEIPSSHFQIPQLQGRLLSLSQRIQPQQDNLKALQEQLATQRESIVQSSQEAQKELHLYEQSGLKERIAPDQVGTSSFLPLVSQHSFTSASPTELERIQEPCPTKSDNAVTSSHSEMPRFPDRFLDLLKPVLPQQDNLSTLQEHLHAQTDVLPCSKKTQKELVFPRQNNFEENIFCEQFIELPRSDLTSLQEQLDAQRRNIRSAQKVQEELLSQRLSKLEKRVSSEQVSSSSFLSLVVLPVVDSKNNQEPFPTQNNNTVPSSNPAVPGAHNRNLNLSLTNLPQQESLIALQEQLDLQREVACCSENTQEELLVNTQSNLNKNESSQHTVFSLSVPKEAAHSFIPLPFAEATPKRICEWYSSNNGQKAPSSNFMVPKLQDISSFSQPILAQQENLGFQQQLDLQREALHCSQKAQEEWTVQRQAALQQQIQKHEETLKDFFKDSQVQDCDGCIFKWKYYHFNIGGKTNFSQDRDPMRVSISREQSLLSSSLDHDSVGHRQPSAQENVYGDDYDEAVKVKESAILCHAVEEQEPTYLDATVKPDYTAETQEISHEPLSSVTISTGSLLSYENTDLSLTDPESFTEQVDHRHQESTTGKEEEINLLSSVVPPIQKTIYERQKSSDVHKSPLPAVAELTSGQTHVQQIIDKYINEANLIPEKMDFKELEYTFPNLHRQLFKPLEPHPDFDLLSLSSGISQDSRDFYMGSESSSESQHATASSKSTVSFTALRRSLHSCLNSPSLKQQPDPNLACVAAQNSLTENITKSSERPFQQLLPEFFSQEESQHADLPSIFSIEARDSSQSMENQNYPSEEVLQIKERGVYFPDSLENLLRPSDEVTVFKQSKMQHSTPCGSTSSECSMKDQPEVGNERRRDTMLENQGLIEDDKNEADGVLDINPHEEETDSQLYIRTVEMGTSVHTPHSVTLQNEKYLENSTQTETPEILRNLSQPAQSFSVQSSIPTLETESGHGIMEEPELTLVSTSDNSITETDFENLTLEENSENEAKSGCQVSEFLLLPEAASQLVSEHYGKNLVKQPTGVFFFPKQTPSAMPESLQEAFLRRKKLFIERSTQRQKEIRKKTWVTENLQVGKHSTGISHLKGVSKDRVSLPEDRRTEQALMYQRALRSCNQLSEVKEQREKKARQAVYAQNRARAREFHKKTLEKL